MEREGEGARTSRTGRREKEERRVVLRTPSLGKATRARSGVGGGRGLGLQWGISGGDGDRRLRAVMMATELKIIVECFGKYKRS